MQNVPEQKVIKLTDVYNVMVDGKIITTRIKKFYINNVLRKETYMNNNFQEHRDANSYGGEGPAIIIYRKDGKTAILESWCINGKSYRDDDLPTTVEYNKEGKVITHLWFNDGSKLHRDPAKGPAHILYNEDGSIKESKYYNDGIKLVSPGLDELKKLILLLNNEEIAAVITMIKLIKK